MVDKHDTLCAVVAGNLSNKGYYPVVVNQVYHSGEIDVLGLKTINNKVYAINIKVGNHFDNNVMVSARKQLERNENLFLKEYDRVFNVFIAPDYNGEFKSRWFKRYE